MSVRPCQIPQNGVLRRLFRPARFSLFPSFFRTDASASAPTTSRTMRSRVFGTDFRVSTISSIKLSSRRTFVGFMVLPLSLLAVYVITSIDSQTVELGVLTGITLVGNGISDRLVKPFLIPTRLSTLVLKQLREHARNAGSNQGFHRSVFAHDHWTAACVFNKLNDGTGYFSKSH